MLDPRTLVAGDLNLLHAAIDQRGQGSVLPKTLAARIAELEGRFDAWGAGEIPEGLQSSAIDRFDFGVSLRQGLEVTGQMHVRSTKDAEKLMEMIRFFEAMFAGQKKTPANGVKFDLKSEHQTVKLSLYVPEEELKKGIQAQKGNLLTAFMGQTMGTAPKPAVTVAPPTPERITTDQRGDTVNVTLPRKEAPGRPRSSRPCCPAARSCRAGRASRRPVSRPTGRRTAPHCGRSAAPDTPARSAPRRTTRGCSRSEEHTSELPPLPY